MLVCVKEALLVLQLQNTWYITNIYAVDLSESTFIDCNILPGLAIIIAEQHYEHCTSVPVETVFL